MLPEPPAAMPDVDALAYVERAAGSLEPTLRARALAIRVSQPDGLDWALRGLYDPEAWVQVAVVDALAARGDGLAALDGWIAGDRDPYARAAGAVAVGSAASATSQKAIAEALSRGPSWARAPLSLAATAVGVEGAEQQLASELRRGEIPMELRFVADLARVGHATLIAEAMDEGATYIEPEIAPDWAVSRVVLGDSAGLQALRGGLSDPEEERRLEVLDALRRLTGPEAASVLRKARAGGSDTVGAYATCLLVGMGELPPSRLASVAASPVEETRALAMACAGGAGLLARGRVTAEKVVLMGLADESPEVRMRAARTAQVLLFEASRPFLRSLVHDDDQGVRLEAAGALLSLDGVGGQP